METLEYHFALFENEESAAKDRAPLCSHTFLPLGTEDAPLFCVVIEGLRGSITSQIAMKMSSDAATMRAFGVAEKPIEDNTASEIVRESFKSANTEVYQYGHRMGAGGKMGATAMIAALAGNRLSMGRVGQYEGYLYRESAIVPLFEAQTAVKQEHAPGVLARFIGANAQILVDLASVKLKDGDLAVLTTLVDSPQQKATLLRILGEQRSLQDKATLIVRDAEKAGLGDRNGFVALIGVGRPTIMLREVVD